MKFKIFERYSCANIALLELEREGICLAVGPFSYEGTGGTAVWWSLVARE